MDPLMPIVTSFLRLCPLCHKSFTKENSYNRHISYCRRAQTKRKGRPQSCVACNTSKTKCSFARPQCARCEGKGIECIYDDSRRPDVQSSAVDAPAPAYGNDNALPEAFGVNPGFTMPTGLVDLATAEWLGQGIFAAGDTSLPLEDQQRDIICGLESFGLGPVHSFSDNEELWAVSPSSSYLASSTSTSSPPSVGPLPGPPAASLASHADADEALASSVQQKLTPVYNLVHRRQGNPASKHAASLISHIVSAFPQMMLRRQTFPPFIHAYWHRPNVPEILGNCMSIAQLYAVRTPETRPFLWRSIETEHKRFRKNLFSFSPLEIQQAVQALSIYIIMAIVDQDGETPRRGASLMQTFIGLKGRLHELDGPNAASLTEDQLPSATWEDWVFAESRRRIGCLWFVIRHVFSVDPSKDACRGFDNFGKLALMSSKTAWEARTRDEWASEKAYHDICRPMTTFGELVAARKRPRDPVNAQKLNTWEAGADKLALLMNIAVELTGDAL